VKREVAETATNLDAGTRHALENGNQSGGDYHMPPRIEPGGQDRDTRSLILARIELVNFVAGQKSSMDNFGCRLLSLWLPTGDLVVCSYGKPHEQA
jgi:hypothetical protein